MPHRYIARKIERFIIFRVLHVDDTPHRIALGVAIGIFLTWTPTIGGQMILTVLLSVLLRANKAVGVPFVWISNPATFLFIYGPNYWLGSRLLGGGYSWKNFAAALQQAATFEGGLIDGILAWWNAMIDFFWPLWVGSLLIAPPLAIIAYFVTRWGVVEYRRHKPLLFHRHKGKGTGQPDGPAGEGEPADQSDD